MKSRIGWIDAAKGMGIFLVVLGHALPGSGIVPTIIWAFHMPLFFFLSGLTAKPWMPGAAPAFIRGLKSLVVPYVFFSLVSIGCWAALRGGAMSGASWIGLLKQMAYGVAGPQKLMEYNVPLWFFTCLMSVRLLFAALTAVLPSKPLQIACVLLAAVIVHAYILNHVVSIIWNVDVALVALVFFVAGYAVQWVTPAPAGWTRPMHWAAGALSLLLFAASVAANGRVDINLREFGNPAWFYAGAFSGIALMAGVAHRFSKSAFLQLLGRASIVIFPAHALSWLIPGRTMPIAKWYAYKLTRSAFLADVVISIAEIVICLLLYFAIVRWAPFLIGQTRKAKRVNLRGVTGTPKVT